MDIVALSKRIEEVSELAALQVLRLQNPGFDLVTKNEAYQICGSRRWLDHHIRKGHIKPEKRGNSVNSPYYFSRVKLAALVRAEQELKFNDERYRNYQLPGLRG